MWEFLGVCVITIGIVKIYQAHVETEKEIERCFWEDSDEEDSDEKNFNKCLKDDISELKTLVNSLEARLDTLQEKLDKKENEKRASYVL